MQALAISLVSFLLAAEEKAPDDEDVVAGWTGFAVLVFLIVAVALIGFFLTRQLRRADDAKRRGVFGDVPAADADTPDSPDTSGADGDGGAAGSGD